MEDVKKLTSAEYGAKNDYATVRVPESEKMSGYAITMMIIGLIIALSSLYAGASFANGLNLSEVIKACIIGDIILFIYAGLLGVVGARESVSVTMLSRHSFGRAGQGILSLIVAISLSGWYAYQCNFFGLTIHAMFPNGGIITNPIVAGVWGGLMMMITAYFGSKGLSFLSNLVVPLILIMSMVGVGVATHQVGGWSELSVFSGTVTGNGTMTVSVAIVVVVGAWATGGIIQPDITRFSKSAKTSVIATFLGTIIAQFIVIVAGYIICIACKTTDLPTALLAILGTWSLFILIFAQWTTNDNNLYSTSLAVCSLFPKLNKKHVVIVVGLIAIALGATGFVNNFVGFLSILGVTVPPVGGIIIADYFILHKGEYKFGKGTRYGYLSMTAVISWIVACLIGYFWSWGIATINSMAIALVLYLILEMAFKNKYSSEDACREHLFKNKWPNGFICEKCGCFEYYYIATRKSYECKGCCYQASVTSNTIMHKTHTTLEKWFWVIYLVARDKRGLSALALSK